MIIKSDQYPEGEIHQTIPDKFVWRDREGNWWVYYASRIYNVHVLGNAYGINFQLNKSDRKIYPDVYQHFEKILANDFFNQKKGGKNGL